MSAAGLGAYLKALMSGALSVTPAPLSGVTALQAGAPPPVPPPPPAPPEPPIDAPAAPPLPDWLVVMPPVALPAPPAVLPPCACVPPCAPPMAVLPALPGVGA